MFAIRFGITNLAKKCELFTLRVKNI